jgi:hypothetical protein
MMPLSDRTSVGADESLGDAFEWVAGHESRVDDTVGTVGVIDIGDIDRWLKAHWSTGLTSTGRPGSCSRRAPTSNRCAAAEVSAPRRSMRSMTAPRSCSTMPRRRSSHTTGAALITGGPGTGKTAVLRERFARLIEAGAEPERTALVLGSRRAATPLARRCWTGSRRRSLVCRS